MKFKTGFCSRSTVRKATLLLMCATFEMVFLVAVGRAGESRFLLPSKDASVVNGWIEKERPNFLPPVSVTGISVPHHMLAGDLIARGFWAASRGNYKRIILISPDHFHRVEREFAVDPQNISTVFGELKTDTTEIKKLSANSKLFEQLDLSQEHGLHALAPFIKRFFPDAAVIPIAASNKTKKADWDKAVAMLSSMVDNDTLIIQSTDYSHFRSVADAAARDQEALSVIAHGDPNAVVGLLQPDHLDSKAAQYIQMRLQHEIGASSVVIGNRNSSEYSSIDDVTTSYIVTVYHRDAAALSLLRYADQRTAFFGGDFLAGRYFLPILLNKNSRRAVLDAVTKITLGAPMIINLEGVLTNENILKTPVGSHLMNLAIAGPVLKELNVVAAGIANNHSYDFGLEGVKLTTASLRELGIAVLRHGELSDVAGLRVLPISLVPSTKHPTQPLTTLDRVGDLCKLPAQPPFALFVHWGAEYTNAFGDEELAMLQNMAPCGATFIVGAHSHRAATEIMNQGGQTQAVFSLGNFLFDQNSTRGNGSLLEVRSFSQGTAIARLVPIPNLFDLGRAALENAAQSGTSEYKSGKGLGLK